MQLQGAIFDMDGTLVDSLGVWNVLWEAIGKKYFGREHYRPEESVDAAVRTMIFTEAIPYILKACNIPATGEELLKALEGEVLAFYRDRVQLKPDMREFLEHLRQKNVRLCIASATQPELIRLTLRRCGIDGYFQAVISCCDVGCGKNRPDVYQKALETLGTPPAETAVFEDSYVALETAASLGVYTVGIYDPYNYHQDRLQKASRQYIAPGETVGRLIPLL